MEKGFYIGNDKYVEFERSTAKSRIGNSLFIKEIYYNKLQKWSLMGLNFKKNEKCDIASLRAYESLTLSSIIGTLKISKENILIIDDKVCSFKTNAKVTSLIDNSTALVENKEIKMSNDIWDGQSLLDVSLFTGEYENKGCVLLRNKFFKSCAFNTNIQDFYKDNNIKTVIDMFGNFHKAEDIKFITTPNSLKALKFNYKVGTKEDMFNYWLKNIDFEFGVCKYDKKSKFGSYQKLTYQMINSMPFTEKDIKKLMKEEIKYINLLKNDLAVFKLHVSLSKDNLNSSFILDMLSVSDEFYKTKMFKDYRRNIIINYIKKLRRGKIKIPNCDYSILFGNPIEMLKQSGRMDYKFSHNGNQVYSPMFKHGVGLTLMRNPHICPNNVIVSDNIWVDDLKYFNLTDNIIVINSHDNDILDRANGADHDSDTVLVTNNKIIFKRAKECVIYLTPVNSIKIPKTNRNYNIKEKADVDFLTNGNKIGEIVNLSAILNSYYWNEYNKKNKDNKLLEEINSQVSMLSALSGLEIDKAKAFFDNNTIHMVNILNNTRQLDFIKRDKKGKIIKPMFFKYCAQNMPNIKNNNSYEYFDTPMDYVQKILDSLPNAKRVNTVELSSLIRDEYLENVSWKQINEIINLVINYKKDVHDFWEKNKGIENAYHSYKNIEYIFIENIQQRQISNSTMLALIKRINNKKLKEYKYRKFIMDILYDKYAEDIIKHFKQVNDFENEHLVEDCNGKIKIFGKKYQKRCNL